MRHDRRVLMVRALAAVLLLAGGPGVAIAAAAQESPAPIADADGVLWTPHTQEAFLALPAVRDFDRVIASVSKGSFRGWAFEEMEGAVFRSVITQRGRVTRSASSGFGTKPTVTYVAGNRACTRTAVSRKKLTIERDQASDFDCRAAGRRDLRGREWVTTLTPTAFAKDGGAGLVYLVRQETAAPEAGVLAQMMVIAMQPNELKNYGVVGFVPQRRLVLAVRPDRVDSDLSQGNGYGWVYQWRTIDSTEVPSLPSILR